MGLIESLTGWQEVSVEKTDKGIIAIANKKFIKKSIKISHGKKNVPKMVTYINGNTFRYKIVEPKQHYHDNMEHGGFIAYSTRKYYRKLRN